MGEDCDDCGADLLPTDSYLAVEDIRELEVVRWSCVGCGVERESVEVLPDDERRVA